MDAEWYKQGRSDGASGRYFDFVLRTAVVFAGLSILIVCIVSGDPMMIPLGFLIGTPIAGLAVIVALPPSLVICLPAWSFGWLLGKTLKWDILLTAVLAAALSSLVWIGTIKVLARVMRIPLIVNGSDPIIIPTMTEQTLQHIALLSPIAFFASIYAAWHIYEKY